MKLITFIFSATLILSLWGCGPAGSRQEGGTIIGAVAGGVIGNQFGSGTGRVLATVAGAVVGGAIGSEIGRDLDEEDRRAALRAEYEALEDDEESRWRNEDSGHYGYIRPRRSYHSDSGYLCREYEHTIYIDDEPRTATGTACRQPDGSWRTVS